MNQNEPSTQPEPTEADCLYNNKLVRQPIARIDQDVMKNIKRAKGGTRRKYTVKKMQNMINTYFEKCEKKDIVPSKKGLMIHLKLSLPMFSIYRNYPEFTELMDYTEMVIENWCESDVYNTPGAASGKIAYMKNVHGWREKTETETTVVNKSVDEARAKLEAFLPQLLEQIKKRAISGDLPQKEENVIDITPRLANGV